MCLLPILSSKFSTFHNDHGMKDLHPHCTTLSASLHDFSIFICLSSFLHAKLLLRCELRTVSSVALVRQLLHFPRLTREIRRDEKKKVPRVRIELTTFRL